MRESGENVIRQLQEISKGSAVGSSTAFEVKAVSEKVVAHWSQSFDVKYGGFGAAPKVCLALLPLATWTDKLGAVPVSCDDLLPSCSPCLLRSRIFS